MPPSLSNRAFNRLEESGTDVTLVSDIFLTSKDSSQVETEVKQFGTGHTFREDLPGGYGLRIIAAIFCDDDDADDQGIYLS